jgi:hypothetical protein
LTLTFHARRGHSGVKARAALEMIPFRMHPTVRTTAGDGVTLRHGNAEAIGRQQSSGAEAANAATNNDDVGLVGLVAAVYVVGGRRGGLRRGGGAGLAGHTATGKVSLRMDNAWRLTGRAWLKVCDAPAKQ